jgi:hypothetical protein
MVRFYGEVGENQTKLTLPYELKLAWDPNTAIKRITCHEKVTSAVYNIFEKTLKTYGEKEIKRLRLDLFGGCLNVRRMRGGSAWSIHSWGAAIDLDPNNNQLKWGKERASFAKPIYNDFWKIVETEGGVSLGKVKNFDWMHFQFATL